MADPTHIRIFDTTLRDGEQSPGATMTHDEKLEIAGLLDEMGGDIIEAGFPAASPAEFDNVQAVARRVRGPGICGLARAVPGDVDAAIAALESADRPRIHVFVNSSDMQLARQLGKDRNQVRAMAEAMVARARAAVDDVEFSPMDATRADPEFVASMVRGVSSPKRSFT